MPESKFLNIQSMPLDVLIDSIFIRIDVVDLLSLSRTCRSLYSIIQNTELIWKQKVSKDFRFPTEATGRVSGFKDLYKKLINPQVWVWGQNRDGRLGLGRQERDQLMRKVLQGFDEVPTPLRLRKAERIGVIDLQAGGWSFHGLDVHGNVWRWGTLDGLHGGWSQAPHRISPTPCYIEPEMLQMNGLPKFQTISCGRSHAMAICDNGHLYEWHSWHRIAKLTSVPWNTTRHDFDVGKKIIQISAGWDFSALLTDDGSIYYWREPTHEEVSQALEIYEDVSEVLEFNLNGIERDESEALVYELDSGHRIIKCPNLIQDESMSDGVKDLPVKIATGSGFIICLTASGKIFKLDISPISGSVQPNPDSSQQAILQDREEMKAKFSTLERYWEYLPLFSEPCCLKESLIKAMPEQKLDSVSPNITHISAQYQTFVAYSVKTPSDEMNAAANSFVFIGKNTDDKDNTPEVLPGLQRKGVIQVCLGDYHYAALLSSGQLLTWGSYSAGALGLGHPRNPHRKLCSIHGGEIAIETERPPERNQIIGNPTAVQSFSGQDSRLAEDDVADPSKRGEITHVPRRYVFSATAAGWHTGCLAFTIDEESDHDYGLGVLAGAQEQQDDEDGEDEDEQETGPQGHGPNLYRLPWLNPNGPLRFRIGYAGRFMRGLSHGATVSGGLLSHHGFRALNQSEEEVGTEAEGATNDSSG